MTLSLLQGRPLGWQAVFFLGIMSALTAIYNLPWHWPSSSPPAPFQPAVVPPVPTLSAQAAKPSAAAVVVPAAPPKIIQSLPPATFDPQIAPASIPELEGIERPAPEKKRPAPEFGVQNGYEAPTEPQPENVR